MSRKGQSPVEYTGNLKYGDAVLLYNFDQESADNNKSGFILADLSGASCPEQALTVHPGAIDEDLPKIQYSEVDDTFYFALDGTFKVVASNNHDAQNRHTALREELQDLKKQRASEKSIHLCQVRVAQVKRDVKVERIENEAKQRRIQGGNVKYGDRIQLQHTLTGRFVCASITDTSITDNTKLKVFLQKKDSVGCTFSIQPRVKVQTGKEVNYADQIKFESVATLGQYLHCSTKTFGDVKISTFSKCFEVNLSAKDSPLKIIHYSRPVEENSGSSRALSARQMVRFFHQKHQCYAVGEGSFVGKWGKIMDHACATTFEREQSMFSLVSSSHQLQVTVDVEPSEQELDRAVKKPIFDVSEDTPAADTSIPEVIDEDEIVSEDAHFRKREGKNAENYFSPSALWQIEKVPQPCSGEPMEWSEKCYIKHVLTGRYLAVTENLKNKIMQVTLKNSGPLSEESVFELHPDAHEARGEIALDSSIRIKHSLTKTWLHLEKNSKHETKIPKKSGHAKERYQMAAKKEINTEDVFSIEDVDSQSVKNFHIVTSVTTILAEQIEKCESCSRTPHPPTECGMDAAVSSLLSLKHLGSLLRKKKDATELKKFQKLLRSMKTLVLVVRLMNLHKCDEEGHEPEIGAVGHSPEDSIAGHNPEVSTACFSIITHFLEGVSSKTKSHISEMTQHIFTASVKDTDLKEDVSVENALIGMAKENPKVLFEEEMMKGIVVYVIHSLSACKTQHKAVQLLEILTSLCSCHGASIKKNQDIIFEEFQNSKKQLLYSIRRKPKEQFSRTMLSDEHTTIEVETEFDGKKSWRRSHFEEISSSIEFENIVQYQELESDEWHDLNCGRSKMDYFVAEINLLAAMCRGNNSDVIQALQSSGNSKFGVTLPFEVVITAIIDHKLRRNHPEMVTAVIELLKVMYVDVGENQPFLEKLPFAFKLNEVEEEPFRSCTTDEKAAAKALTGVTNEYFRTIRDWIEWFFHNKSEYSFAADEEDQNGVVVKVLQVLTALVKYGYYDDPKHKDIEALLPAIHELLDGRDDYPTRELRLHFEGKKLRSGDNNPILHKNFTILGHELTTLNWFDPAEKTLRQPLRKAKKIDDNEDLDKMAFEDLNESKDEQSSETKKAKKSRKKLEEYQKHGRFESMKGMRNHFQVKHWAIEVLYLMFNFQLYKSLYRFIYDFRQVYTKQLKSLKKVPKSTLPHSVREKLHYLIGTNPRDKKFVKKSPSLAGRIMDAAKQRLKCLTEESGDVDLSDDQKLPDALIDLSCYDYEDLVQRSLMLLDRYYTSKSDIFLKAIPARLLITPESVALCEAMENREHSVMVKLLKFLRPGSSAEDDDDSHLSVVEELTKYCWLEDEVEGYEPHQINQKIFLSFSILSDIINFVVQYCDEPDECEDQKLIDCLFFLRALACKNSTVQDRLLEHLDVFIKAISEKLGSHIGMLLREVFSGGPSVSLFVREDQIREILQKVFAKENKKFMTRNAGLLDAVHELMLVKDLNLPLKRNQLLVAKFITQIRENEAYWCKKMLAAEKYQYRKDILELENDSDPRLINLLMIADLLATCAIGDNEVINSICCTIYGEKELIGIIADQKISLYRKRPFMKLLVWVYMTVQGGDIEERCKLFKTNRELWNHMEMMATVLQQTSEVMSGLDHSSYLAVKELLACPVWKYSHQCPQRKHTAAPPQVVLSRRSHKNGCFEIADVLLYYSEALLPFLKIFYDEFYEVSTSQRHAHASKTESIYVSLLTLFHPLMKSKKVYFTHQVQVKLYFRVLFLMKSKHSTDMSEELMKIESEISSIKDAFHHEVVSEAREKYKSHYEEEIKLNMDFNQYVMNYKAAYEGRNTVKDQVIGAVIKKKKMAEADYSEYLDESMTKPGPKWLPLGRSFQEHVAKFTLKLSKNPKKRNPKERLIRQLEISFANVGCISGSYDEERQIDLDLKCLRILRAAIYNRALLIDEEEKERSPKLYREACRLFVHPIQNEIQDLGNAVLRVMPLLSHPNERIVHEVLAFLEAILKFGNTHVQEGLNLLIRSHDHQLFATLRTILKRASTTFNESEFLFSLFKSRSDFDQSITWTVQSCEQQPTSSRRNISGLRVATLAQLRRSIIIPTFFRRKKSEVVTQLSRERRDRVPFLAIYKSEDSDIEIDGKKASDFRFYDLSQISFISEVLGLMCDGQYKVMQKFLREQADDNRNVNMVAEIATFLYELSKKRYLNMEALELFNQLLVAIKEFCVGNKENRSQAFEANIILVINHVLQIDITNIKPEEEAASMDTPTKQEHPIDYLEVRKIALELKSSAVSLLDVLLEEIGKKPFNLSKLIAEGLDTPALHWSMLDFYTLKDDPDLQHIQMEDNACRALYDCHRVIMYMKDNDLVPKKMLEPGDDRSAWEYCEKKSKSIEVVYNLEESDEEVLGRVHFIMDNEYEINEQLQDRVKWAVSRTTHAAKLRDFREWMDGVKKDTLYRAKLDQNYLTSLIQKFSRSRYWLMLSIILALNILLIIFSRPENDMCVPVSTLFQNGTINSDFAIEYITLTYVLGGLFAILTVWMLLEYFIVTWPHFVLPEILFKKIRKKFQPESPWMKRLLPKVQLKTSVNIFGIETLYLLLFIPVALSPLYCFGYLYCYCFFYIIINNDILQRALQSVTRNWKSLFWVAVLLVVILYTYAVISFVFLRKDFNVSENLFCERLDDCFISVLRFGLIDNFLDIAVQDSNEARAHFFFDITFFIIVTTIGLNIVFGIIVDTFSELRDEKFAAEQDLRTTCFICNLQSYKFDKKSHKGFQTHIDEHHNMWNYIYYSIYLDQIDVTDHNATQKYLYDKIIKKSIDYIPFQRAIVLKGKGDHEDELKEDVEELKETVEENFATIKLRFDNLKNEMMQAVSQNISHKFTTMEKLLRERIE